jgi:hypothetical protein
MDFLAISNAVIKFAPKISYLLSLNNPVSEIAVSLISQYFNLDSVEPDKILNKLTTDPDVELKLKQLENDHAELIDKLAVIKVTSALDNQNNARDREINKTKILNKRDWVIDTIAIVVVFVCISVIILNYLLNKNLDDHLLDNAFIMVLSYYFGASIK